MAVVLWNNVDVGGMGDSREAWEEESAVLGGTCFCGHGDGDGLGIGL